MAEIGCGTPDQPACCNTSCAAVENLKYTRQNTTYQPTFELINTVWETTRSHIRDSSPPTSQQHYTFRHNITANPHPAVLTAIKPHHATTYNGVPPSQHPAARSVPPSPLFSQENQKKTLTHPLSTALAAPLANQGVATNTHSLALRASAPLAGGVPLRVMPLGASITYGTASSDGNGYRLALRTQLAAAGNPVNMVGSRQAGTMRDNDVEGWPGYRIEQVRQKANAAGGVGRWRPNVVLVNAGTNDATQGWNVSTAGERMEGLLRDVWSLSPRAVVVLSTLLVNRGVEAERNVGVINRQLVDVAKRLREGEGRKVVLVDMHGEAGPGLGDLADSTHPNDVGYRKMADVWLTGLVAASDAGWLQAPEPVQGVPDDGAV